MATKNRRVAAYLPLNVDKAFIDFKIKRGLATEEKPNQSDSQALIDLLSEFLGVGHSVAYLSESDVLERLTSLEKEVAHLRVKVDENQRIARGVKDEVISELQSELPVSNPGQMSLLEQSEVLASGSGQSAKREEGHFIPTPESIPQDLLNGLSAVALGERMGADRKTIPKHRDKGCEHFQEWSRERDPDGIPWSYRERKYYPVTKGL